MQSKYIKSRRVLYTICVGFIVIAFRVFHLAVIQREDKLKEAEKPKQRTILLRADRGEICDRFHIPLATNQICYNAAIYYCHIQQILSKGWTTDENGTRIRTSPRREYIKKLSELLADVLELEAGRIEDLIHSKASLFPHVPYILKTNLSESEYYRLKMLEKDWPGLHVEIGSERYYPQGKVGCHLIGMLGSISSMQFSSIAQEIKELEEIINLYEALGDIDLPPSLNTMEDVYQRLEILKDKAYTLNDKVGKDGIEKQYEEQLRGSWGIKTIEVDNQGKPVREIAQNSKPPIAGNTMVLTISAELQQFAEELLIQNEKEREGTSFGIDPADKIRKNQKQPWMKGGAIVAIDPNNGEVLALASYPRFDPNDFIHPSSPNKIHRWLENRKMLGALWDGEEPLTRERMAPLTKKPKEEQAFVTWEFYLNEVLTKSSPLKTFFDKVDDIKTAIQIQEDFQTLLYFSKGKNPTEVMEAFTKKNSSPSESLSNCEEIAAPLRRLESHFQSIPSVQDRLFAIDLCRLCIDSPRFGDDLIAKIGHLKMASYRNLNQAFCRIAKKQKALCLKEFRTKHFALWKNEHQKEFLMEKRSLEKKKKTYSKPYIDYLDKQESELFQNFWEEEGISLLVQYIKNPSPDPDKELLLQVFSLLSPGMEEEFLKTFRFFEELDLKPFVRHSKFKTEQDIAAAFYPMDSFGFCRSYGFQANVPQGSIFKMVSGYEGLRQGHHFSIIDEQRNDPSAPAGKRITVAYSMNKTPYPRIYKGGRLPKSSAANIGQIDIVGALERSSNPYFAILAGDYLQSPEDLNTAASLFGYGSKTGIDLPREKKGNLPTDLKMNRTGLYSYSMGQHTLLSTPLQSALMLSAFANGGHLLKPQIVKAIQDNVSEKTQEVSSDPEIKHSLWIPPSIRDPLFEGLDRCMWSDKGNARPSAIPLLLSNPQLMQNYLALKHQMIGKTGTAEILYNPGKYPSSQAQMYKHIWFGSIAFQGDSNAASKTTLWEHPELVVVVFLPFGSGGKGAAPLASQMIHKWREISKKHESCISK